MQFDFYKKTLLLFILLSFCFSAYCEEIDNIVTEEILQNDIYTEESIFIINYFNYNVKGKTLPYLLNTKTELKKGEVITGKTNFEKFIKDKKQLLINERVLNDNVRIEYSIGEITEDGKYPVDLEIYVEDTKNFIVLPYPKYDSNYGIELTIKARDYNFLGTLQPLKIDIGYKYNQHNQSYFSLIVDSGLPFQLFGFNWLFDFDNYFDYRPDLDLPFYFKNKTGISLDIPIKRSTLTFLFSESFILNEENPDTDKPDYGFFQEGLYLSSSPSISWKIPTGLEISNGELTYTPNLYAVFNHEIAEWQLSDNRIGPILFFDHTLDFGRLDWIGNFREGILIQIDNSYSYNFYYPNINKDPWEIYYDIEANAFFTFIKDRLGFSSRLSARHWINYSYEYAGDFLRGVSDNDINAEFMLSLNLDLHLRVLRIKADEIFKNKKILRSLGFDLHINPVIDVAYYKQPYNPFSFDSENFLFGAGFEIIIYPHKFRSMFFRISTCWDLSNISEETPIELFLGMEHHY